MNARVTRHLVLVILFLFTMPMMNRSFPAAEGNASALHPIDPCDEAYIKDTYYVEDEDSLRNAIEKANGSNNEDEDTDRIIIASETITLKQDKALPSITNPLCIMGDGQDQTVIDGDENYRVFQIDSEVVVKIIRLTVRKGDAKLKNGGAIDNKGSLTLESVTLTQNKATNGGSVQNSGTLTISNTVVITANLATNFGGGVYNLGDSITIIGNSMIIDNEADYGGGIFNERGVASIKNSDVSSNIAEVDGGGIYNDFHATVDISDNARLENNLADGSGGGIVNKGVLTIYDSLIQANKAPRFDGGGIFNLGEATIVRSTIELNEARGGGGIINWKSGDTTLISSTLSDNVASQHGGGIQNGCEQTDEDCGTLTIDDSTISGNTVQSDEGGGGGIRNFESGEITITNSTITGSTADYGGGIHNPGPGSVWIQMGNDGEPVTGTTVITNNIANSDGGGIFNTGTLMIGNTVIESNGAVGGGGIINWKGGDTTLISSTLSGNVAYLNGGGIQNGGILTIENSGINGNRAEPKAETQEPPPTGGGGIRNFESGEITITNSTITGNTADYGGGIHNPGPGSVWIQVDGNGQPITDTLSVISDNRARSDGGGIFNTGMLTIGNTVIESNGAVGGGGILNWESGQTSIINSTLDHNWADNGGGIENGVTGVVTITENSRIVQNSAEQIGGGIVNFNGSITISVTDILTNVAVLGGGGVWNQGSGEIDLRGSLVSGNQAFSGSSDFMAGGGGIRNIEFGKVTIANSTITENQSQYGGGIHNSGNGGTWIQMDKDYNPIPGTTTISSNFATRDGGGIYNGGPLDVVNTTLNSNSAFGGGGGILNWQGGDLTIEKSTLSFNGASNGGGIEIGNNGVMTLTNVTLANNTALNLGGGIVVYNDGKVEINHGTLAYNVAHKPNGSGIHNQGTISVTLDNTLLAENLEGPNCYGSIVSENHNLSDDNSCPRDGFPVPPDAKIDTLKDNGGPTKTIALLPKSPAINAIPSGDCLIDTDQRGVRRPQPQNGNCDIGAYELKEDLGLADPGSAVTVSTVPLAAGEAGVMAEVMNNTPSSSPISVTLANYANDPTGVGEDSPFEAGTGFVYLQLDGQDLTDEALVHFYYSSTFAGDDEAKLMLLYYIDGEWVEVRGSGSALPRKDMADNLDGTVSGGRFTVRMDSTSLPAITDLTGTVFTAQPSAPAQVYLYLPFLR